MLYAELVKSFTQYRFIDKQKAKQTLAQMKEFEKNNEEYAFCSCFYEAQSYYDAGDLEQSVKYAIECIANLMKRPYRVELAKSYNLIGMINLTRGDILEAIDYFLNALEIARKHKEEELESYIYNNLGCTYHQLKDYQTGILYVTKAYNLLAKRDSNKESKMVFALNLALMHCEEEEWEQTQYYYQVAISDSSVFNMEANTILLAIVQIMMAYHKKNHKIIYEKIDCIAKEIQKNGLNLDDFNELVHMIRKIMNPSLKNKLHMLLLLLDKEVDSLLSTDSKIAVLCCKIEYYKMINEQDKMNDLLTDFYELSLQKERENEKTFLESANIKLQMQALMRLQRQTDEDARKYKEKAEHDELTGLFNRTMLKNDFEPLFLQAKQQQKHIGIIVFDINYFKQFNDCYGHVEGDRCIRELTSIMLRIFDEKIRFIRYGGDEFIGFFYNMDAYEIKSISLLIDSEIKALNIENKDSLDEEKVVSITQSGYLGVPNGKDNLYDFIRKADDALYEGKRNKQNIVIHRK